MGKDTNNSVRYKSYRDYIHDKGLVYNDFDVPSRSYVVHESPKHGVELFRYKSKKISNSRQLFAVTATLIWRNDFIDWDYDSILMLLVVLGKEEWGATTTSFSDGKIEAMANDLEHYNRENKLYPLLTEKKISFGTGYTKRERLDIIKKNFAKNRKVYTEEKIKTAIDELISVHNDVITYEMIAKWMGCALPTIKRNIGVSGKQKLSEYNNEIRYSNKFNRLKEAMMDLLFSGEQDIKVRRLKEITSIKDYELIKEVISCFE